MSIMSVFPLKEEANTKYFVTAILTGNGCNE